MANTLDAALPVIIAKGAMVLRKRAIMPLYVNTDYSKEVSQKGQVIKVPVSAAKTVSAVTPGPTPPAPSDTTLTEVDITLSEWNKSDFHLTEKQAAEIMADENYLPLEIEECFNAIANQVNADIFSLYKKVYGYVGTAGTTPFATTTTAATDVRKQLNKQFAPIDNRALIIDPDAESNALNLPAFQYALNAGDTSVARDGRLGFRLGFQWDSTTTVPTHTAGTITTGLIAKASTAQAAGLSAITATTAAVTGACALVVGDIIAIAGQSQTYTLTAAATQASAATDVALSISPPLVTALAGSEAITVKASHIVNLALHKGAFAFAARPLDPTGMMPAGTKTQVYIDPLSRIPIRLDYIPGYHQMTVEASILYGFACIRPELAVRLAG